MRASSAIPVPPRLAEPAAPWFLGPISLAGAERLLKDKCSEGHFLVRRVGVATWAVSVLSPGKRVVHFAVVWTGDGFSLESGSHSGQVFVTLESLVDFFSHEALACTDAGETIVLRCGVGVDGLPQSGDRAQVASTRGSTAGREGA